jgi:hypothetical protein
LDICQTVALLATQQPELILLLAEQGIPSRIREIALETNSNNININNSSSGSTTMISSSTTTAVAASPHQTLRELSVVALCCLFRSSSSHLFRKALLLQFSASPQPTPAQSSSSSSSSFLSLIHTLLSLTSSNSSRRDAIQTLIALIDLGKNYKTNFMEVGFWTFLRVLLEKSSYDVKVDIGEFH